MNKAVFFQIIALCAVTTLWALGPLGYYPRWLAPHTVAVQCILVAALAGVLYCLRAIYVNQSVGKAWDAQWDIWYLLRPFTSGISGLVAYIFLRAGVIVLEADTVEGSNNYGYLAFAFVAGYNVDNFLRRIEDVAKSAFSVDPSRASRQDRESG